MHDPIESPQRKRLRLRGCDYAFPGVFFVTICSAGKRSIFGSIREGKMAVSVAGAMVRAEWIALPKRFARLVLDEFVIMPNHLHGVLGFVGFAGGARPTGRLRAAAELSSTEGATPAGGASPSPTFTFTLPGVIGAFKSISTIKVNRLLGRSGPLWQRSYYEHIVRTGDDLGKIRRYIFENPLMWPLDRENPDCESS